MSITHLRPHPPLLLAALALFFAGIAFTQDKPDRPPWAQKPKSSAGSASSSSPTGEPGKIVQPTPPAPTENSQESAAQRGRIRVNVNLVNVLVSVLDEKNRPAPTFPGRPSNLLKEAVDRKFNSSNPEIPR